MYLNVISTLKSNIVASLEIDKNTESDKLGFGFLAFSGKLKICLNILSQFFVSSTKFILSR